MLNTLGYDAGTADGFMGARTRNAIRAFESDVGLSMTGNGGSGPARRTQPRSRGRCRV